MIMTCSLCSVSRLIQDNCISNHQNIGKITDYQKQYQSSGGISPLTHCGSLWQHRSGSTLPQVIVCCLLAPSHYLNQCWLVISEIKWQSPEDDYTKDSSDINCWNKHNKANLRDLIAATGLVILLKFDPNHRFFVPCDLEIWWMALKNNRAPLLYYIKLCASFQIHRWIQIGITVRKRSIWVKIGNFLSRVTLKFDRWHRKTIEHLFYVASSFVYHFTAISEFKLELQSGNAQFWSKSMIFLAVWPWNLMDDLQKQ